LRKLYEKNEIENLTIPFLSLLFLSPYARCALQTTKYEVISGVGSYKKLSPVMRCEELPKGGEEEKKEEEAEGEGDGAVEQQGQRVEDENEEEEDDMTPQGRPPIYERGKKGYSVGLTLRHIGRNSPMLINYFGSVLTPVCVDKLLMK
jgi:hypothetical protein